MPFDTKIISQTEQDGVTVTKLSYAAHNPSFEINFGGRTVATLVSPKGSGPFAGIMYMHSIEFIKSFSTQKEIAYANHFISK